MRSALRDVHRDKDLAGTDADAAPVRAMKTVACCLPGSYVTLALLG